MKKLKVTVAHLEQHSDGTVTGVNVAFQIIQQGRGLVEDSLSGKALHPFSKTYDVDASDAEITVTHDRQNLSWLTITVEIVE